MKLTPEQLQAEIGKRHGRLLVVGYCGVNKRQQNTFRCRCDCGRLRVCTVAELNRGIVRGTRACRKCARARVAQRFHGLLKDAERDVPLITRRGAK